MAEQIKILRERASRFRQLSLTIIDERAQRSLIELAEELELRAKLLEQADHNAPSS